MPTSTPVTTPLPLTFPPSFLYKNPVVKIQSCVRNLLTQQSLRKILLRMPEAGSGGFVDELRRAAVKLHTREQARGGEREAERPEERRLGKWEPSVDGYLKFLVDSKVVFDTLEAIIDKATFPSCAKLRDTDLERSGKLAKDLEWFRERGYAIPEPGSPGVTYARFLEGVWENDPQAFICHFYNIYFAHSAGGRMIGKMVAEKLLDKKELEFYKWDGDLPQLLQNVKDKLNQVSQSWTREEKDHCLDETERSFKYSGDILRLILI